jgi:thiol-disulfide isomerase/thioredoxin
MKKISWLPVTVLLMFSSVLSFYVSAQKPDSVPPAFVRFPTIPPFELKTTEGKMLHRDDLAKRHGTLIMYFSPECHHCQQQVEWLQQEISKFDKYNLVLATYQPMDELKKFYVSYKLSSWKNLYIGRDEKFFLPPYFRIGNMPFLALYDNKGNLLTSFEGVTRVDKLLDGFRKTQ